MKEAESLASKNAKRNIDTVLFFDEANTTQAIDLIKEIMVDRKVNGRLIQSEDSRLHFIAACNPYRKYVTHFSLPFRNFNSLAHRAKRGARVLILTCVESIYTRGDWGEKFCSAYLCLYIGIYPCIPHTQVWRVQNLETEVRI